MRRVISGSLFALFLVLVFEALALFGVISMLAGHIAVFAAWIVGSILISTEIIPGKKVHGKIIAIVILGGLLAGLDVWAIHVKHALDARTTRPEVVPQSPSAGQNKQDTQSNISAPTKPIAASHPRKKPKISPNTSRAAGNIRSEANPPIFVQSSPGSAVSVGQQGGITAGTVNIGTLHRHIHPANLDLIGKYLSQMTSDIVIAAPMGDAEARSYSDEWKSVLEQSGWRVTGTELYATDQEVYGVTLTLHGDTESQPGRFEVFPSEPAYWLAMALELEGVELKGHRDPKRSDGQIYMVVGINK